MAADSEGLLLSGDSATQTSYKLDLAQTSKACQVLLKQIEEKQKLQSAESKPNLLADSEGEDGDETGSETPIWLIATTKKHIVDKPRLKPSKIILPHPYISSSASICLITADPQRLYKDTISADDFPANLRQRITRVIGHTKLKAKYKSFESRRQLAAEHDIFLADSRIITYLPKTLGKVFYKSTAKRPVSVEIGGPPARGTDGKRLKHVPGEVRKSTKGDIGKGSAPPTTVAREVERALTATAVNLAPSTTTAVKVGNARFTSAQCAANIETVVDGLAQRLIPSGWRNIKALHIKGPNTMAFPIWLADELWVDETDVREHEKVLGRKRRRINGEAANDADGALIAETQKTDPSAKRKGGAQENSDTTRHASKKRKTGGIDETAARKERLKKQKEATMAEARAIPT